MSLSHTIHILLFDLGRKGIYEITRGRTYMTHWKQMSIAQFI